MIIRKVAVGNSEEAFIEDTLSEGLNILLSDSLKQDYKHLIKRLRERVQISDIMESVVGAFECI